MDANHAVCSDSRLSSPSSSCVPKRNLELHEIELRQASKKPKLSTNNHINENKNFQAGDALGRSNSPLVPNEIPSYMPNTETNIFEFPPLSSNSEPLFDIPEAPVFYPTPEEFQNPAQYIKSIAPLVEPFGICRIIPPKKENGGVWDIYSFYKNVEPSRYRFHTKAQSVHRMQKRNGPNVTFLNKLKKFYIANGKSTLLKTLPQYEGRDVDLYKLYLEVKRCGGLRKVIEEKRWPEIAYNLHFSRAGIMNLGLFLQRCYVRYLQEFVEHEEKINSSVSHTDQNQQSQTSQTSMSTSSSVQQDGRVSSTSFQVSTQSLSLTEKYHLLQRLQMEQIFHLQSLQRLLREALQNPDSSSATTTPTTTPPTTPPLTPPTPTPATPTKKSTRNDETSETSKAVTTTTTTPQSVSSSASSCVQRLQQLTFKENAAQFAYRTNKGGQYKQRTTSRAVPHWKEIRLRSFVSPDDNFVLENIVCTVCGKGDKPDKLLICDNHCNRGTHMDCLNPPLKKVPKNEWYCDYCTKEAEAHNESGGEDEYGYEPGMEFSLKRFELMAREFEYSWFHLEPSVEIKDEDNESVKEAKRQKELKEWVHPNAVEREYWRIVESGEERVIVYYGSDLDVMEHGSGFPLDPTSPDPELRARALKSKGAFLRRPTSEEGAMAKCGWNLNNLPLVSALKHLKQSIAGVTRPMMYVGMLFSTFCWHTEDNFLYSINYVHTGKPKNWYGVSGRYAADFERVMRQTLPELFVSHPNLLHMLITMQSPRILKANGVPVVRTIQHAGEFVVTFPRAYHAGFNHGFNVAESVNFALTDWISFGRLAVETYRFSRSAVFSHHEYIVKAALDIARDANTVQEEAAKRTDENKCPNTPTENSSNSNSSIKQLTLQPYDYGEFFEAIERELERILQEERTALTKLKEMGVSRFVQLTGKQINEDCKQCELCGFDCYLSGLMCDCSSYAIYCMQHIQETKCSCPIRRKKLVFRYSVAFLEELLQRVKQKRKSLYTVCTNQSEKSPRNDNNKK
jgi:histone demethylase JARID1